MEQKNLKTNVFSLDTVFCESAEQPIDADFTLPDYYSDISKILKCRAVSRISSKGINGSHISVEGCVTITVIYCGSDGCISSYEHQHPFSKNFDTGMNTEGCILSVKTKCEYINCRAVTGRKIDVHGAAGIYASLTRRKITEVVSDVDNPNVEVLRGSIPATMPIGCSDKYLTIEEELELGTGQPDIHCLIRYDADASVTDSKIMAGKSVVKGEMNIKMLYSSQNGTVHTVRSCIPFSQMIELESITDQCSCESKVCVAFLEIKPRISASGDSRSFLLNCKLLVTSECYCNNDVSVILDAYSRRYEADISKSEVCFSNICENLHESFSCKKNIEFASGTLSAVSDMWSEVKVENVRFDDKGMTVNGVVTTYIIALDTQNIPCFYEKAVEFQYIYPMNVGGGNFKCSPEITVSAVNYTITGESNMELRIELNISAAIYECSNTPLILDISLSDEPVKKNSRGAMTAYFASKGENIWDIARNYFADVQEVKQINEISENVLCEDKMILIPNN